MSDIDAEFVQLARLALNGQMADAHLLVRRALRGLIRRRPDLASVAKSVLAMGPGPSPTRAASIPPPPIDLDSRMELLRRIEPAMGDVAPVWPATVGEALDAIITERRRSDGLRDAGLTPTRSALFVGPPGTGKTLAAHWLARELDRELLVLDLAAVMSSFLGRTGGNLRAVLDYARSRPCILLLDEFDAIAKRRDDSIEVGELKRLVTVLLQAIDDWPASGILVAATNHPNLLDAAAWRRFERIVEFPVPDEPEILEVVQRRLGPAAADAPAWVVRVAAIALRGHPFAEVVRRVANARRLSVIEGCSIEDALVRACAAAIGSVDKAGRLRLARELMAAGFSQRQVSEVTGLARDTLRARRIGKSSSSERR